jgi:hypothetical protein
VVKSVALIRQRRPSNLDESLQTKVEIPSSSFPGGVGQVRLHKEIKNRTIMLKGIII